MIINKNLLRILSVFLASLLTSVLVQASSKVITPEASKKNHRITRVKKIDYPKHAVVVAPLALDLRGERNNEQQFALNSYQGISLGYRYGRWGLNLESMSFKESSGNTSSYVVRNYRDMQLWSRFSLLRVGDANLSASLIAGAGLGGYSESVTTGYLGLERADDSKTKLLMGLSAGAEVQFYFSKYIGLEAGVDGAAIFAQSFDPNPAVGIKAKIGFLIRF